MAVSVRMEPVLEQQLEQAARQLGVSKSQFIIDAVESALGRRDPFALLQKAQRQYGVQPVAGGRHSVQQPAPGNYRGEPTSANLRSKLQTQHDAEMRDWLAYQAARRRGEAWSPDSKPGKTK